MELKAFYSAREVAEVLDLHEVTVLRLLREGEIPAGKVGRQWRVSHAALEKMLGTRIEAGKHPLAQPSPAPTPADLVPDLPPEDGPMKDTGDLSSPTWTDQDLLDLAEEAFAAGDEAQVALVAAELRQRGEEVEAEDIESRLDKRLGQTRFTTRCPRPEATPGGILDLVQALRRTVDQAPARHRTADDLRHLRTAERILAALQEDLDTDDDDGPNAAVRRLQEVAGALQHADHLLDAATEALPENIREEFAGDLLLVMDRTRQALEDLERLERAVRNRL